MNERPAERMVFYCVLLTAGVVSMLGFFNQGWVLGHDLPLRLVCVSEYVSSLKGGIFPVRWAADLDGGFGNPMFIFSPPLFPLVCGLGLLFGCGLFVSIKLGLFFFKLAGLAGMYRLSGHFFGKKAGLVSACFFAFAPYIFVDIFIRNAYQEFAALCVVPWVFYFVARLLTNPSGTLGNWLALSVSFAFFLMAHPLSWLLYIPFLGVYVSILFLSARNTKRLLAVGGALLYGTCMAAFYVIPFLSERNFIHTEALTVGHFDYRNNYVPLGFLFHGEWYSLGSLTLILIAMITVAGSKQDRQLPPPSRNLFILFYLFLTGALFMSTAYSRFFWGVFPTLQVLQFPWRFFSTVTFCVCFLTGSLAVWISQVASARVQWLMRKMLIFLLAGYVCVLVVYFFEARMVTPAESKFTSAQIRQQRLRATVGNDYWPKTVKKDQKDIAKERIAVLSGAARIRKVEEKSDRFEYEIKSPEKAEIQINLFYYPGWKFLINHREAAFRLNANGLPLLDCSGGTWRLEGRFEKTPLRRLSDICSLLAWAGILLLWFSRIKPVRIT